VERWRRSGEFQVTLRIALEPALSAKEAVAKICFCRPWLLLNSMANQPIELNDHRCMQSKTPPWAGFTISIAVDFFAKSID